MGRQAKLSTEQIKAALDRIEYGETLTDVAEEYGVAPSGLHRHWKKRQEIKTGQIIQTRHLSTRDNVVKSLKQECQRDYGSEQPALKDIRYWIMLDYSHAAAHGAKASKLLEEQAVRMCRELDGLAEECGYTEDGRPMPSDYDIKLNRIKQTLQAAQIAASIPGGILLKESEGKVVYKEIENKQQISASSLTDEQIEKLDKLANEAEQIMLKGRET